MTATADIVTQELRNTLLVPNAALRFKPSASDGKGGGITSVLPSPRRFRRGHARQVSFGAGSSQTVYVLNEAGEPKAVQVTVGASDGARTAVIGGELKAGMRVITGQLAAGQEAPAEDQRPAQEPRAGAAAGGGERRRGEATDGSPARVGTLGGSQNGAGGGRAPETAPVAPAGGAQGNGQGGN
ncbi:MAG: efflux RND transporter periplasmic adaptor subunit, partial [Sphingobium sp.]